MSDIAGTHTSLIIIIALTSVFPRLHGLDGFPKCHSSTHKCRLWQSEFWSKILRPDALPGVNLLQIRKLSIFIVTPSLERLPTKVNEYHLPGFYIGVVLLLDELPSPWLRSPICPIKKSNDFWRYVMCLHDFVFYIQNYISLVLLCCTLLYIIV